MSEKQVRCFYPKLDKLKVFACLTKLESVKFGFLELGSHCDASGSEAFGSTHCHFKNITNEKFKHFTWNFTSLFHVGYDLLKYIEQYPDISLTLPISKFEAIRKLEEFLEEKGKN